MASVVPRICWNLVHTPKSALNSNEIHFWAAGLTSPEVSGVLVVIIVVEAVVLTVVVEVVAEVVASEVVEGEHLSMILPKLYTS